MVGALAGSTQREPLVVGKPSTFMMDYLANKYVSEFCISSLIFGSSLSGLDHMHNLISALVMTAN